jgi:hypothetical protein
VHGGLGGVGKDDAPVQVRHGHAQLHHLHGFLQHAQRRLGAAAAGHLGPQLDLGQHGGGEVRQHLQLVVAPRVRRRVDHAEAAQRLPVQHQGHSRVGHHPQVGDGQVGGQHRVGARVAHHQRGSRGRGVLAERVRQRGFAHAGPRLGQPRAAQEYLPVIGDQRHQRHGDVQQAGSEARKPIERPGRVGPPGQNVAHGGQPLGVVQQGKKGR